MEVVALGLEKEKKVFVRKEMMLRLKEFWRLKPVRALWRTYGLCFMDKGAWLRVG